MTAVDRDPVALAREVLDMNDARDYLATAGPLAVYSVGGERYAGLHVSEKIERRLLEAAPDLARTVIDLTAKVERVEALADLLEREADELNGHPSRLAAHTGSVKKRTVARIRTALNGENHD